MREQPGNIWRLASRTLATPVLWYRHGRTGRELVLVLNSHMGTAGYFATIRQRVSELEARGYAVQAEGIRKASADDWASASGAEKDAHEIVLAIYRDVPAAMARGLGWAFQADPGVFPGGDGWATADLTDLDVVRMIGAEDIMALGQAMAQGLARAGTHRDAYLRAVVPFQLRRLARPHDRISALTAQLAPSVHDVLMGRRSVLAAAAASPDRDWVLIWGAEHAEPVRAGLEAAGWIPAGKRRWVTVGQLPPLALCWARLAAVAGKVGLDTFRASMAELEARGAVSPSGTGPG